MASWISGLCALTSGIITLAQRPGFQAVDEQQCDPIRWLWALAKCGSLPTESPALFTIPLVTNFESNAHVTLIANAMANEGVGDTISIDAIQLNLIVGLFSTVAFDCDRVLLFAKGQCNGWQLMRTMGCSSRIGRSCRRRSTRWVSMRAR